MGGKLPPDPNSETTDPSTDGFADRDEEKVSMVEFKRLSPVPFYGRIENSLPVVEVKGLTRAHLSAVLRDETIATSLNFPTVDAVGLLRNTRVGIRVTSRDWGASTSYLPSIDALAKKAEEKHCSVLSAAILEIALRVSDAVGNKPMTDTFDVEARVNKPIGDRIIIPKL